MKKRIIVLLLGLSLLLSTVTSCLLEDETNEGTTGGDVTTDPITSETPTTEPEETSEPIPELKTSTHTLDTDATWVKLLDNRMERTSGGITCDWSCAGIEFTAECSGTVTFRYTASANAYFRAYVDGNVWNNGTIAYYTANDGSGNLTLRNLPYGLHTIRLVKATGYTLSQVLLQSVTVTGNVSDEAPEAKELFIEFVGDSISCGWGVIGAHDGTYSAQDGTLAYPYLLANEMNADYSVVAVSGQGIVFGNPNIPTAYKYASFKRNSSTEFSFERKADIVVLNVGTNDVYQKDTHSITSAAFKNAFRSFVNYVRAKNGADCKIVAVYGMMNDTFGTEIAEVINDLGGMNANYFTFQAEKDASGHPTITEQANYAKALKTFLTDTVIPNVPSEIPDIPDIPEGPESGLANGGTNGKPQVADYEDFFKES